MTEHKVGIFGGSFNPVHLGHLLIAQCAMERMDLASVLFMPCPSPPHKPSGDLAPAPHRFEMLRLAIADNPVFNVSDREMRRSGTTYTIDTLEAMKRESPETSFYFIIGSDTLFELHTWKRIENLLPLCRFITLLRPGSTITKEAATHLKLPDPWPETLLADTINTRQIDIASSDIRRRIAQGRSIRYLVPRSVDAYIENHHLYETT